MTFDTLDDVARWFDECIRGDYDGRQVFQEVTDEEAVWFVWCSLEKGTYTRLTEGLFFRYLLEHDESNPRNFGLRP